MSVKELQATVPVSASGVDTNDPVSVERTMAEALERATASLPDGYEAGQGGALRVTITWHTRDGVEVSQDDVNLYGLIAKMIIGSAAEAMGELMKEHVDPEHSAPAIDLAYGVGVYQRRKQ